jgi:asparagine synthase (glutamine-hydrolysing)
VRINRQGIQLSEAKRCREKPTHLSIRARLAQDLIGLAQPSEHRLGGADHSRRLWTVLIFLLWYAIFVELSVVPQISEPQYPVRI